MKAALRTASRDTPRRASRSGALCAFGTLAPQSAGADRRELLRASAPDLAAMLGSPDPTVRYAAIRVIGRVFEKRTNDDPVEANVGDAVITALNEKEKPMQEAAIDALGAMRYDRAVQGLDRPPSVISAAAISPPAIARRAGAHRQSVASVPLFTAAPGRRRATPSWKTIAIEGSWRGAATRRASLAACRRPLSGDRGNDDVQLAGTFAAVIALSQRAARSADRSARAAAHARSRARGYLIEVAPGHSGAFTRQLQDPDARLRGEIVDILGLAGDRAALPLVEPMTKDPKPGGGRSPPMPRRSCV